MKEDETNLFLLNQKVQKFEHQQEHQLYLKNIFNEQAKEKE